MDETISSAPKLDRSLLFILTATTVLSVGNVYYSQPLLGEIAKTFGTSPGVAGMIPTLTQLGYVAGLLFLTPLGDVLEKRGLVTMMLLGASLAMLAGALSPSFVLFAVSALAIGLTAVLVQVLIPFVATLSAPEDRGRNLGILLSGALIGILVSRTLSGFIGAKLGWRGMYFVGSGIMLGLAILLHFVLPKFETKIRIAYPKLLHSMWILFRDFPELRKISINGALMYGALSAFWASLAFYLQSDAYHLGPEVAGAFGLVGALGALAANVVGRNVDKIGATRVVQACCFVMALAYVVFMIFGGSMPGLICGVILLDLGAQAATVSNQTMLYRIHGEAQTRLNTIYKMLYFVGGALGSSLSAFAWQRFEWRGVCGVGLIFLAVALLRYRHSKN